MPNRPFMGVRISWVMVARNLPFACSAELAISAFFSASTLASSSCPSLCSMRLAMRLNAFARTPTSSPAPWCARAPRLPCDKDSAVTAKRFKFLLN